MIKTFLENKDTSLCCGCTVCADSCAVGAISFEYGADGAMYPTVDGEKCVSCGMCRKACPIIAKPEIKEKDFAKKAYALMVESDVLREKSASGGAFEAIASALHKKYKDLLIAGAAWGDDLYVYHKLVRYEEIDVLKKSKYVQSNCEGIYKEIKRVLNDGIHVLFTGTPCQVVALKNYLKKEYDNLFLVDLICHGTPGAKVFQSYLKGLSSREHAEVIKVEFRYKKKDLYGEIHSKYIRIELNNGKVIQEEAKRNPYLRGFHAGLFYRDSCYHCQYANVDRFGDITIGDYWRIQELNPKYVDYSGVSCLLVNTKKGWNCLNEVENSTMFDTPVDELYKRNGQLLKPSKKHLKHDYFISEFEKESFEKIMDRCIKKRNVT